MSGFPKRAESDCDAFDTGHSSTSISAALGMVHARQLRGENNTIVAVIGDGSITGGLAYEAMNNVSKLTSNLIIILNDNNMSISENVGGISTYLNDIRTSSGYIHLRDKVYYSINDNLPGVVRGIRKTKNSLKQLMVPGMYFEQMGITYLGPVDGHNIRAMQRAIERAKHVNKAVLIHVCTKKGKGYTPAEKHPSRFHGTSPFEIETGLPKNPKKKAAYTDVFSTVMIKLAQRDPKIVAITAAMADGVGLKRYRNIYPDRFFDVGIAEGHAVTFAAGLAAGGMKPVVAIYSTFLQRAYDQIVHDVCMQNLPVIFAIDRAGLVGEDGETHQGVFDLSYLSTIPNLTVMAPKNKWELSDMLKFAVAQGTPCAIRYPRGEAYDGLREYREKIALAEEVHARLAELGIPSSLVNARFVTPDEALLDRMLPAHSLLVTMEENVFSGGFGEHVIACAQRNDWKCDILPVAVPDRFIEHGAPAKLKEKYGIDAEHIAAKILERTGRA